MIHINGPWAWHVAATLNKVHTKKDETEEEAETRMQSAGAVRIALNVRRASTSPAETKYKNKAVRYRIFASSKLNPPLLYRISK